jgi:hypothetical protein
MPEICVLKYMQSRLDPLFSALEKAGKTIIQSFSHLTSFVRRNLCVKRRASWMSKNLLEHWPYP